MQGKHLRVSQCMQSQLIHSEPKWSQRCRLNGLQLGEFCWTRCQLTPTFTYRFRHWEKKRKQTIKKRLRGTPFLLLPESQFKSSSSPSHPPSVTLPQFCPALHSALGYSNGWHGMFGVVFHLPLLQAFLHHSFCLPAPLPQHRPPPGCSPSAVPAPMCASPTVSP